MKKWFMLIGVFICLGLAGCSEDEGQSVPENDPNSEEVDTEEKPMRPPTVHVHKGAGSTYVEQDVWCWKEEELCTSEPTPPNELISGNGWPPLRVSPGELVDITISTSEIPETDHIYYPDSIEATQVRSGEEEKLDVTNKRLTAPTEEGKYYYTLKLQWDGELVGQAYYAFSILVREE